MMKKLIAILIMIISAFPVILAQGTVTGMVVDKKGNPLPGVKIEIPGTPDQAISDLDGTFTINRSDITKRKVYATYAGMRPAKVKISDNTVIKMREENWWSMKPDKWQWFAEAMVALPNAPGGDIFNPAYGLMLGRIKKFGYYIKGITNTFGVKANDWESAAVGFINDQKTTYWSVTGGGLVRLGSPIHLYLGVGYADYSHFVKDTSGNWHNYTEADVKRFAMDLGLLLRIKKFTLSLGLTTGGNIFNFDEFADHANSCGNFGIGYTF